MVRRLRCHIWYWYEIVILLRLKSRCSLAPPAPLRPAIPATILLHPAVLYQQSTVLAVLSSTVALAASHSACYCAWQDPAMLGFAPLTFLHSLFHSAVRIVMHCHALLRCAVLSAAELCTMLCIMLCCAVYHLCCAVYHVLCAVLSPVPYLGEVRLGPVQWLVPAGQAPKPIAIVSMLWHHTCDHHYHTNTSPYSSAVVVGWAPILVHGRLHHTVLY